MAHFGGKGDPFAFVQGSSGGVFHTDTTTTTTAAANVFGDDDGVLSSRKGKAKVMAHNPFTSMDFTSNKERSCSDNSNNNKSNGNGNNNGNGNGWFNTVPTTAATTATATAGAPQAQYKLPPQLQSLHSTRFCNSTTPVGAPATHRAATPSFNILPEEKGARYEQEQPTDSRQYQPQMQQQQQQQPQPQQSAGLSAPECVDGSLNSTTASSRPLCAPPRAPTLSGSYQKPKDADKTPSAAESKKSYYLSLLKKEPPDFLKPSPNVQFRRAHSSRTTLSQSPFNPLFFNSRAGNSAKTTVYSRSGSIGTNSEEPQPPPPPPPPHQQGLKELSCSVSATLKPSDRLDTAVFPSKTLIPLERQGDNGVKPSTFFSHARPPTYLATFAEPKHGSSLKASGDSASSLHSGSLKDIFAGKNHHENFVDGRQPPLEARDVGEEVFMQNQNSAKTPVVDVEPTAPPPPPPPFAAPAPAPAAVAFAATLRPTSVHAPVNNLGKLAATTTTTDLLFEGTSAQQTKPLIDICSVSRNTNNVTGSLFSPQRKQLPPSLPLHNKDGETGMSTISSGENPCFPQVGLETPRNGGMGLQRQHKMGYCGTQGFAMVVEGSPAPFPPSSQELREHFSGNVAFPTAEVASHIESNEFGEDKRSGRPMEFALKDLTSSLKPPVANQMTESPFSRKTQPVMTLHGDRTAKGMAELDASTSATLSEHPDRFHPAGPHKQQPQALQEAMTLGQANVVNGVANGIFSGTEAHLQKRRLQQKHSVKIPCYALFTSTGNLVMVSNVTRSQGAFAVVKSQRLADVLSASCETGKVTEAAKKHIGALRTLISFSSSLTLLSKDKSLSLSGLQDIVREMPGISSLLREVLVFLLREPLPDWRTEGHHTLIKILSAATKEMKIAHEGHSHYPLNKEPKAGATEGLQKIQQLLCAGEREAAVDTALEHHLYSHAIIIAMVCPKKEQYLRVISAMVQQELDPFSPLAHAYCMFNEMPLPPFAPPQPQTGLPISVQSDAGGECSLRYMWVQHAAILVSNFTKESANGLIELGDALVKERMVDEAHCCFLLAHLSPMGTVLPGRKLQPNQQQIMDLLRARLGILGGHYNPQSSRALFVSPKSTLLTEVLQIVRSRLDPCSPASLGGGGSETKTVQHGLPVCPERYRAAFRYMQVLWLQEVGLNEEALSLLSAVHSFVPPGSPEVPSFTLNRLIYNFGPIPFASFNEERQTLTTSGGQAEVKQMKKNQCVLPQPALEITRPPPSSSLSSAVAPTTKKLAPPQSASLLPPRPQQSQQKIMPKLSLGDPKPASVPPLKALQSMSATQALFATGAASENGLLPLQQSSPLSAASPPPAPLAPPAPPALPAPPAPHKPATLAGQGLSAAAVAATDADERAEAAAASTSTSQLSKQARGRATDAQCAQKQTINRSSSLEAITRFFFRRSRDQEDNKEEAKAMIIDTAKPPKFDPATGRYLFEETEEEKKVAEMVKAGPPKPSLMTARSVTPAGSGAQSPTLHKRTTSNLLSRAQYVDMFNTT